MRRPIRNSKIPPLTRAFDRRPCPEGGESEPCPPRKGYA